MNVTKYCAKSSDVTDGIQRRRDYVNQISLHIKVISDLYRNCSNNNDIKLHDPFIIYVKKSDT